MIISNPNLDALRVGFKTEFQRGLAMAPLLRLIFTT
jgi:phage major head subunit gpT-like protein